MAKGLLVAEADTALQGLTAEQAAHRLAADGPNELPSAKRRNLLHGTVNLSSPRAIFAGSPPRFTRSRVTYEAYAVSRTSTRPQVDSAALGDVQKPCGDVFVGQSFLDESDDVALGRRERAPADGGPFAFAAAAPCVGDRFPR